MAKRFASIFFISIGVALCCVLVFALVLFLAPGLSVFGIKYIAKGTHIVHETTIISDKLDGYSGSIRLEVEDIPVQVVFSQGFSYQVEYYDNFNGLTSSKIDDPSISYAKADDGTAVIKITSFKKFIYENGNSTRYVKLLMPASNIGEANAGLFDLSIISKNSSVTFYHEKENSNYTPYFRNLKIETSGDIISKTEVIADNYSLKTINAIKISDDKVSSINATNYNLESTGGKIVVDRDVVGDINATTKNARIQIRSCNNFTANSGFGDVYSASETEGVKVNGVANITTTAGVVKIDSILGVSEKSVISTKTGNVTIKKLVDADITTTRGFVFINSARKANIKTSSGSITLEEATNLVTAKSKRGKITLGGENAVLYNPTVEADFGKVSIQSASGTVKVTTLKSSVELVNKDSSNVTINAGGSVTATNLIGAVNVETQENAKLDFKLFSQKSTIVGKGENSTIQVNMLNNNSTTFSYVLEGNDASLYEYNSDDPQNHHQIGRSTSLTSSIDLSGKPLLSVSSLGKVIVYYQLTK